MNPLFRLFLSFVFAFHGLWLCLSKERNFLIQLLIALAAVIAGYMLKISNNDFLLIVLCIVIVLCLEMVNSAIEQLCNLVTTDFHPSVKKIKDISAGAVLLASIISVVIGCVVFIPKIIS